MSKATSAVVNCQARHSRNTHDWTIETDKSGRVAFVADGEGVWKRMAMLVKFLGENGTSSKSEMGDYLSDIDPSYRDSDVSQPIKQLIKINAVKRVGGFGKDSTYDLTPGGSAIYKSAKVRWV